ncbi:MAG: septal ring lytic transglycosylase RlpA family protein [Lewinellaceae bacterium]|nr:septal ring lytic transglycosylase RlpA family protein [Lewinellaceae bacterium]
MIRSFLLMLAFFAITAIYAQGNAEEIGKAAYYADKFDGRLTASGKPYDKNAMTCAHKTHPFGTQLRVTRLDDNQSVVVTVTDRGPYNDGFIIDLSRKAAEAIDMIRMGVVRVKVEPVTNNKATGSTIVPAAGTALTAAHGGEVRVIKTYAPETASAPVNTVKDDPAPTAKSVAAPAYTTKPVPVSSFKVAPPAAAPAPPPPAISEVPKPVVQFAPKADMASAPIAKPLAMAKPVDKSRELYQINAAEVPKAGYAVQLAVLSSPSSSMAAAAALQKNPWKGIDDGRV